MVVWLFAGGGESEVEGLVPFLEQRFPTSCQFERKTPVRRKPEAKYKPGVGYGRTGKSFEEQIKQQLQTALANEPACDLILVIDDLDCRDYLKQLQKFSKTIESVNSAKNIKRIIGFAAPEIEAWLIADWEGTLAKHVDFRGCHEALRWWLSQNKQVSFDDPESFSQYDAQRDCCEVKLSQALIEATEVKSCKKIFSKGVHTPLLLRQLNVQRVGKKCPIFKAWYEQLVALVAKESV